MERLKKVTDDFYFTLYQDEAKNIPLFTLELSLTDESEGQVTYEDMAFGEYYVAESDRDGNPVGSDFGYQVILSDELIHIGDDNKDVVIEAENHIAKESPQDPPKGSGKPAAGSGTGKPAGGTGSRTKAVKTGDTAAGGIYITLILAAGFIIISTCSSKRKNTI